MSAGSATTEASALPTAPAASERVKWLDVVRGIGMVLVVLGHALAGYFTAYPEWKPRLEPTLNLIYSFHMPLFFFLAGMLSMGMLRLPLQKFSARALSRIVYPYFLWSVLFLLVHSSLGALTNNPSSLNEILTLPVHPVSVYWFLRTLLLGFILAYMLKSAPTWVVVSAGLAMVVVGPFLPTLISLPAWFSEQELHYQGVYMVGFFLLGQRTSIQAVERATEDPFIVILAIALIVATLAMVEQGLWYMHPALALAGPFGLSLLAAWLAMRLERGPAGVALGEIGRASMAIFVTHVMAVAGVRIIGAKVFDVTSPLIIIVTSTLAGIIAPYIAYRIAKRIGFNGVLAWR